MALARWKDLCIDAADAEVLGRFWASALDLELELHDDGDAAMRHADPARTIWVNRVPEPKVVKHRAHLDVGCRSVDDLVALGADVVAPASETGLAWTLLTDPEGGELCAFERDDHPADGPPATLYEIVIDTADEASSRAQAVWWADVLGGAATDDGRGFWWVQDVPGLPFDAFVFAPVPEPKTVKNRIHWDLECGDVDALVAKGAAVLAEPADATPWHVLADPEGNEVCAFAPR